MRAGDAANSRQAYTATRLILDEFGTGGKFQRCVCLCCGWLRWADVGNHDRLGVASQRVLRTSYNTHPCALKLTLFPGKGAH